MREKDILREAREFVELRKEEMRKNYTDNDISEMKYIFHDIELMRNILKLCIYKEEQNKKLRKRVKLLTNITKTYDSYKIDAKDKIILADKCYFLQGIFNENNGYIDVQRIKARMEILNKEMLNEQNSREIFYRQKYAYEVLKEIICVGECEKTIEGYNENHIPHID